MDCVIKCKEYYALVMEVGSLEADNAMLAKEIEILKSDLREIREASMIKAGFK